jgi:hypothetical protein
LRIEGEKMDTRASPKVEIITTPAWLLVHKGNVIWRGSSGFTAVRGWCVMGGRLAGRAGGFRFLDPWEWGWVGSDMRYDGEVR